MVSYFRLFEQFDVISVVCLSYAVLLLISIGYCSLFWFMRVLCFGVLLCEGLLGLYSCLLSTCRAVLGRLWLGACCGFFVFIGLSNFFGLPTWLGRLFVATSFFGLIAVCLFWAHSILLVRYVCWFGDGVRGGSAGNPDWIRVGGVWYRAEDVFLVALLESRLSTLRRISDEALQVQFVFSHSVGSSMYCDNLWVDAFCLDSFFYVLIDLCSLGLAFFIRSFKVFDLRSGYKSIECVIARQTSDGGLFQVHIRVVVPATEYYRKYGQLVHVTDRPDSSVICSDSDFNWLDCYETVQDLDRAWSKFHQGLLDRDWSVMEDATLTIYLVSNWFWVLEGQYLGNYQLGDYRGVTGISCLQLWELGDPTLRIWLLSNVLKHKR